MLEARNLTKIYGHTLAVRQVSFTIQPGEILGYLGGNGAGKSTTVKMLTGLLEPSDGQIFFEGKSVHEDVTGFRRRIGYVPEEAHLYPHLTGREYLQLTGRLRGMPRAKLEAKIDGLLRLFSLWNDRHDALSSYSKGMRQKILLSAALLHNPDVLILDEPFSGLDVNAALVLRSLLRKLAAQGKMILFSSHVLEVVEKVCSKVLILRRGEVAAYGSIDQLQELMSQPSLEAVFAQLTDAGDGEEIADRILEVVGDGPAEGSRVEPPVAASLRVYRALAGAFPQEFQNMYGAEMIQVTEDAIDGIWRRHGLWGMGRLLLDVAVRLPAEYLTEFGRDAGYGVRALAATPWFTLAALVSLSLGICIATCAFSEMNGMALRTVPGVAAPAELLAVQAPVSWAEYKRFRDDSRVFTSSMAYAAPVPFATGQGERTWGHLVSSTYFPTLGVKPAAGRFFEAGREVAGTSPEVVVSEKFWRQKLGGNRNVAGSSLRVNGHPVTVLGVAPEGFQGGSPFLFPADVWMTASSAAGLAPELTNDSVPMFFVVGRLKAGVGLSRAEAALDTLARKFEMETKGWGKSSDHRRLQLVEGGKLFPLRRQDVPFFTSVLTIMAGLVMLLTCASVANMMLARAAGRRKEIAVRLALGASRARLIRQLLTESLMLAGVAGIAGYTGSVWLMKLSSQVRMPFPMPVAFDFTPDGRVLAMTIAISLLTGIVFGLAPALQATKPDVGPALKDGGGFGHVAPGTHRKLSLRNVLIVSQVSSSLTLLVILGLLSVGIQTTLGIQRGFRPGGLYALAVDPVRDGYSAERAGVFFERLMARLRAEPGISAAALTETVPVSMPGASVRVRLGDGVAIPANKHTVGDGYFETAGIQIVRGRSFAREDAKPHTRRVIVSTTLARELWNSGAVVGDEVEVANGEPGTAKILPGTFDYRAAVAGDGAARFEVIGVAADVTEGMGIGRPRPALYFPLTPSEYGHPPLQGITLLLRGAPGEDVLGVGRREIVALDPAVTPFSGRSMEAQIGEFMAPLTMASYTYGVIGVFGLVLAAVGLAGVTAYSVARRGRELGVRMALGARRGDVLGLVMKEGLALVAVGTAVGMVGAWAGSRLLSSMNATVGTVSSTSTSDPRVLFGAPLVLAALTLLACFLPARRTMGIDPAAALRQE